MSSSPQLNLITIIGSAGLIIIGIILVLSLNTPIYGYIVIGVTFIALITYMIYKRIKIHKTHQSAIRAVVNYDRELFGATAPHSIQLERV